MTIPKIPKIVHESHNMLKAYHIKPDLQYTYQNKSNEKCFSAVRLEPWCKKMATWNYHYYTMAMCKMSNNSEHKLKHTLVQSLKAHNFSCLSSIVYPLSYDAVEKKKRIKYKTKR